MIHANTRSTQIDENRVWASTSHREKLVLLRGQGIRFCSIQFNSILLRPSLLALLTLCRDFQQLCNCYLWDVIRLFSSRGTASITLHADPLSRPSTTDITNSTTTRPPSATTSNCIQLILTSSITQRIEPSSNSNACQPLHIVFPCLFLNSLLPSSSTDPNRSTRTAFSFRSTPTNSILQLCLLTRNQRWELQSSSLNRNQTPPTSQLGNPHSTTPQHSHSHQLSINHIALSKSMIQLLRILSQPSIRILPPAHHWSNTNRNRKSTSRFTSKISKLAHRSCHHRRYQGRRRSAQYGQENTN